MSRFFVPKDSVRGNNIHIGGEEAHHILDVMRLKVLDKVVTFDGTGKEYVGFIKEAGKKSLTVEIVETREPSANDTPRITLIQAVPKKEKMDYIVEKATELGVFSVIPVFTRRTIPQWNEAKALSNVERWRKIARAAAKQCARRSVPEISEVMDLGSALRRASSCDISVMAALSEEALKLKKALSGFKGSSIAAAVGPEGDFTPDEIKQAKEAGFKIVNLGPLVLKSDTAGLALLAILPHEFSN